MSLKSCKECGKQVSSNAKTCPHCGAKLKMGFFLKAIIGFIILGVIGNIISDKYKQPEKKKEGWQYCEVVADIFIEKTLKNPASFKRVSFDIYQDKNQTTKEGEQSKEKKMYGVLVYRGTNSFNAIITESLTFDFITTPENCKILNVRK